MENKKRNDSICSLYKGGMTQRVIAEKFDISEMRVGQILRRHGISKVDRKKTRKRDLFLGIWVTLPLKEAIQQEAANEKKSQSQFVVDILVAELKRRKIDLLSRINYLELEPLLPLED